MAIVLPKMNRHSLQNKQTNKAYWKIFSIPYATSHVVTHHQLFKFLSRLQTSYKFCFSTRDAHNISFEMMKLINQGQIWKENKCMSLNLTRSFSQRRTKCITICKQIWFFFIWQNYFIKIHLLLNKIQSHLCKLNRLIWI